MPASDYGWMLSENKPLFQVYGTKRKHSGVESEDRVNEEQEHESALKRRCMNSQPEHATETEHMEEINHNSLASQNLNISHPSIQHQQNLAAFKPDTLPPSQHQQISHIDHYQNYQDEHHLTPSGDHMAMNHSLSSHHRQQPSVEQNSMIMDLHDETYTTTNVDICEVDSAYNLMDSDYVPDSQQYRSSEVQTMNGAQGSLVSSGKVKSFCRPAWEGLMEMAPYISDYY